MKTIFTSISRSSLALLFVAVGGIDAYSVPDVDVDGDFNRDGYVNAADFLEWQTDPMVGLLPVWQSNYGSGATGIDLGGFPTPTTSVAVAISLNVFPVDLTDPTMGGNWTLVAKTNSPIGIAAVGAVLQNVDGDFGDIFMETDINAIDPSSINPENTELIYGQDITTGGIILDVGRLATSDGPDALGDPLWDDATNIASGTYESLVPSLIEVGASVFGNNAYPYNVEVATASSVVRVKENGPGDFNGDGYVNGVDLEAWQLSYGQQGEHLAADGNKNGTVDGADFLLWQRNFDGLNPCPGSGGVACVLLDGAEESLPMGAATPEQQQVPEPGLLPMLFTICWLFPIYRGYL